MFGGPAPPPSAAELKAQESEAALTVQKVVVGAILLYLSPFAIDAVKKLV
ncbi:mitochondrial outer membrane translocase complex, subunit Tom5 [Hyaloscypha finlandica]|nr:mitochondrial outer membrane translocase complex, subunit Tom5 [Hyaloscypha finlandica]